MASNSERRTLLEQLYKHLPSNSEWVKDLKSELTRKSIRIGVHIAIVVEPYLSAILDGTKTVESRFSLNRVSPYRAIDKGDIIIFKKSGGAALGIAAAGTVQFFELSPKLLDEVRRKYATRLYALNNEFWDSRRKKRFATIIELDNVMPISPMMIHKKDRRGWISYGDKRQLFLSGGI